MPNVIPSCGHTDVWLFRVRDKGLIHRHCLKCLFDKVGLRDAYAPQPAESAVKPKIDESLKVGSTAIIKAKKKK